MKRYGKEGVRVSAMYLQSYHNTVSRIKNQGQSPGQSTIDETRRYLPIENIITRNI
jgi:hypothetical protein